MSRGKMIGTVVGTLIVILAFFYLFSTNQEKTMVIRLREERIRSDSLRLVEKEEEIRKLTATVESIKHAYDKLNFAFHTLSDKFNSVQNNYDSLNNKVEELNMVVNNLRNNKKRVPVKKTSEPTAPTNPVEQIPVRQVSNLPEQNRRNTIEQKPFRQMTDLEKKEKLESKLKAYGIDIYINGDTRRNLANSTMSSTKVDYLKINFYLKSNERTEKGDRNIYVKIIKPDGSTFFNKEEGGFAHIAGGLEPYTVKFPVSFNGSEEEISFNFKNPAFESGKYTMEVYDDDVKIGSCTFSLI